ncbi:MAG: hypothetical protein KF726_16765 [Anaerolineae bacterium]|nr:hypothetical protein [Anaerolineae bacterium]
MSKSQSKSTDSAGERADQAAGIGGKDKENGEVLRMLTRLLTRNNKLRSSSQHQTQRFPAHWQPLFSTKIAFFLN